MISLPNAQPVEHRVVNYYADDPVLEVVEVFPTIQGEGPFAGCPAVFVRLAGCNLQCKLCDTDYTSHRRAVATSSLIEEIVAVSRSYSFWSNLVVLTGGEPFRQPIDRLIQNLLLRTLDVQIETNGTVPVLQSDWLGGAVVVCSPKTPKIHEWFLNNADYFKYVVEDGKVSEEDGLPTETLGNGVGVARPPKEFVLANPANVYISPLDSYDPLKNAANRAAAVASVMKHGYTLSLQTHKLLGLK